MGKEIPTHQEPINQSSVFGDKIPAIMQFSAKYLKATKRSDSFRVIVKLKNAMAQSVKHQTQYAYKNYLQEPASFLLGKNYKIVHICGLKNLKN